jgi:hypothetical protein
MGQAVYDSTGNTELTALGLNNTLFFCVGNGLIKFNKICDFGCREDKENDRCNPCLVKKAGSRTELLEQETEREERVAVFVETDLRV